MKVLKGYDDKLREERENITEKLQVQMKLRIKYINAFVTDGVMWKRKKYTSWKVHLNIKSFGLKIDTESTTISAPI